MAINQCDGCKRGLPRSDELLHFEGAKPVIACTAYLYVDRPGKLTLIKGMAQAAAIAAGADLDQEPKAYYGFLYEAAASYQALVALLPPGTLPT